MKYLLCRAILFLMVTGLFESTLLSQSVVYLRVGQNSQLRLESDDLVFADEGIAYPGSSVSIIGGTEPYLYEWWYQGSLVSTESDPMFEISGDSPYTLLVTDADGCSASRKFTLRITGSDPADVPALQVFPNPSRQYINLKLPDFSGTASVRLSDMNGKLIWIREMQENPSRFPILVQQGMYILEVIHKNHKYSRSIIVSQN